MIVINNLKVFTVNIDFKYHWSKLPKLIEIMQNECLKFPYGAYLRGADLRGADLRGAELTGAYLTGAYLTGANLTGAYLTGANLRGAELTGAYLTGAYLTGANLRGANLRGAELRGAYLTGANLRGAELTGANLRGAELRGKNKTTPDKLTIIDVCSFDGFGSHNRCTYFFNTKEAGIVVQCGCFYGTLAKFKEQVKETHKGNKHEKCYLQMAKLAKLRLKEE